MERVTEVPEAESQALPMKESSREAMAVCSSVAYAGGRKAKSSLKRDFAPSVVMARPEWKPTWTKTRIDPWPGPFQASSARPIATPGFVIRIATPGTDDGTR